VERVAPAVVLAHELSTEPLGFLAREVVPDETVTAVTADVVERAHVAVGAANDDDRRVRDLDVLGEVTPRLRELVGPPHVQPCAFEDRLTFELVERRRYAIVERDRRGAELWIVLRPAAFGRFGPAPHRRTSARP